jgi:hypothetical protein
MQQKSTIILDQLINSQIPSNGISGLGYNKVQNEKGSSPKKIEQEVGKRRNADIVKDSVKKEESLPQKEKILEINNTQEDEFRRSASQIRSYTPKYQRLFHVHYFSCSNFGQKDVNWRAYAKNRSNYAGYLNNS